MSKESARLVTRLVINTNKQRLGRRPLWPESYAQGRPGYRHSGVDDFVSVVYLQYSKDILQQSKQYSNFNKYLNIHF